jgi:hypothetical protein
MSPEVHKSKRLHDNVPANLVAADDSSIARESSAILIEGVPAGVLSVKASCPTWIGGSIMSDTKTRIELSRGLLRPNRTRLGMACVIFVVEWSLLTSL